jgi:hypothetical protein
MASFKVTLDATLLAVMTSYTEQVLDDAIRRLADKYGFDHEDAKAFLQSGGIVVKYPPLEREKLPWTGDVRADCCKAIKKNGGLFTQCTGSIHSDDWCKPCSKEVAKKGKPTCGTVADRAAVDVLEYQVGPVRIKPYIEYMKKHGIHREQVDKACEDYGITVDPRQFELKKRARKPRDMAAAIPVDAPDFQAFAQDAEDDEDALTGATGAEPEEQLESDEEDDYEPPTATVPTVPTAPVTAPTQTAPVTAPIPTVPTAPIPTAPVTAPTPTAPVTEPTPSPVTETTELAEEPLLAAIPKATVPIASASAPVATLTPELIATMDKATAQAHCRARSIDINAKGLMQLKKALNESISASRSGTNGNP